MEASICEVMMSPPKFQGVDHFWISLKVYFNLCYGCFACIYVHVCTCNKYILVSAEATEGNRSPRMSYRW